MFSNCRLQLLTLIALLSVPNAFANPTLTRATQLSWSELLHWLPENTETIMFAQGPFAIPKKDVETFEFADIVMLPTGPFRFANNLLAKELRGQKVLSAMEGSRRFRSPRGLGMMP